MRAPSAPGRRPLVAGAAGADLVLVVVFSALGLASHEGGVDAADLARVVWPFALGLALGWLVALAWRRPIAPVRTGVVVWAVTAAAGLALRVVSGGGAAPAFVVVTAVVLFAFLVGWRVVATAVARRRQPTGSS